MNNITSVESTTLATVGYDPEIGLLRLEFRDHGGVYHYRGVPGEIFQGLLSADSKGAYFNRMIRGQYSFTKDRKEPSPGSRSSGHLLS